MEAGFPSGDVGGHAPVEGELAATLCAASGGVDRYSFFLAVSYLDCRRCGIHGDLAPYEWELTTDHVDFDTSRPVYGTREKCHVSHIVCDTGSWEQKVAQSFEDMDEPPRWLKQLAHKDGVLDCLRILEEGVPQVF